MKLYVYAGLLAILFSGLAGCNDSSQEAQSGQTDSLVSNADDWKLGVQMWTLRFFTLEQAINKLDSAGIRYIEAFPGQPLGAGMKDSFGIRMSAEGRSKLKQLLQQKDKQLVAIGVLSPSSLEEWYEFFELAKEFGLSYITAEPKKEHWKAIDSLAGIYNIKIAIHDHPKPSHYWHPDSVAAAIQVHPNIGACADIGHWARSGLDPVDCLKKLEGHVFGLHLKDIKTFDDVDAADTLVGKGVIDYPAVFNELKRQHFRGMLSIEQESNWYNNLPDIMATAKYYEEQVR